MTSNQPFYQQLKSTLEQEPAERESAEQASPEQASVVVATIVKVVGSAPREVGAKMAICADGSIIGTIGGGAGEGKIIAQALAILKERKAKGRKSSDRRLVEINLTGAPNQVTQGICGGKVQVWLAVWPRAWAIALIEQILQAFETGKSSQLVIPLVGDRRPYLASEYALDALNPECFIEDCFIETIQPPPVLLIIGGGHVAVALALMADFAGFQIAVQDDRPEFVTPERFPQARLLSHSIREMVDSLASHSQLYIALVARGLSQDVEALQTLLLRPCAYQYVGAIGSQKRIRRVCQAVQQQGIPIDELPNFHAPIGLDIGALTPQEIAISICAELIKVRRGGTGRSLCERIQHSSAPAKVHVGGQLYASLP
ncbi:MAG: XdhC family protein [Phormidesmis sp.]